MARTSETPGFTFTFTVLNSPVINAFATPGGFVYVTRGLLALADNEAELAGVMAHEIGHVVARHSAQRYSQAMAANLGVTLLGVITNTPQIGRLAGLGANAGTHVVAPGTSIQAAINASSSGDVIILLTGMYDEDLVINGKALTIRTSGVTPQVKSIVVLNAPAPCKYSHLRVLGDVNATNTSLTITNCNVLGSVHLSKGGLRLLKTHVDGDVTVADAVDDAGNELEAAIVQSTIRERLVCKAKRSWICYSAIRHAYLEGVTEVTGNDFDGRGELNVENSFLGIGIDLHGAATHARIRNNRVRNYQGKFTEDMNESCIGIRIDGGAKAEVINNYIHNCHDHDGVGNETYSGLGVLVKSTTGTNILGNIFYDIRIGYGAQPATNAKAVWAPKANVTLQYNLFYNASTPKGGVVNLNGISGDPDIHNSGNSLNAGSPAINAGPPDAQYNDHDGTRNDLGMHGGHSYLVNGKTTNKPIVLGLQAAPIAVPVGGIITIQSTGAVPK